LLRNTAACQAKIAPVTDLKNRLSHYLRLVARGESVTVVERGRPVARLARLDAGDAELAALAANGLARLPLRELPADFSRRPLPAATRSAAPRPWPVSATSATHGLRSPRWSPCVSERCACWRRR
jgi:antitoxin (DNA-binding transcriptional repressor) of toxin-antitoxin stability system